MAQLLQRARAQHRTLIAVAVTGYARLWIGAGASMRGSTDIFRSRSNPPSSSSSSLA
jgi:hypothetical protein